MICYQVTSYMVMFEKESENDASYARKTIENIMPNDLFIRDLGYFSTKFLKEADQCGAFYVTRFKSNMKIFRKENDVFHELDPVQLGEKLLPGESMEVLDIYLGVRAPVRSSPFHSLFD